VSLAHDVPAVVLDGNVRRVLARHGAIGGWAGKAAVLKRLRASAESKLPAQRGADYTQAIMDLGATVCTRSNPACEACPVNGDCRAHRSGTVERFPASRPRLAIREQHLHMLILRRGDGCVLLERRPPAGIWGGLWSLPDADDREKLARRAGLKLEDLKPLPAFEHRLTHLRLTIRPQRARANPGPRSVQCNGGMRWFGADEWPHLGLPKPVLRLLRRDFHGEQA
jgi:A/G-specific adenine glycosylase